MARELVFDWQGEVSHLPLTKIDRERLYGCKKRVVTDEAGEACRLAYLSGDGRTMVPAGGFSLQYLDEAGNAVERSALQVVDEDGEVLDKLPSTLGVAHELFGPVPPQRVLDHRTLSVYQLDPAGIGAQLAEALAGGEIFEAEFRYTANALTNTIFILQNQVGTFGLVCQPVDLPFLRPDAGADDADEPDEDEDLDDDLDFSF